MPNPYAAKSKRVTPREQEADLAHILGRLTRIGATPDELAAVRDTWDVFDGEWTVAARARLVRLPDDELGRELLATRAEYQHDTTSTIEQYALEATTYAAAVAAEAAGVVGRKIPEVLAWVDGDAVRAAAILDLELGPNGGHRKTIVAKLRDMIP